MRYDIDMIEAFLWGLFAASSLLMSAVLALIIPISKRVVGLIMAFGVGALISAVAYELIDEGLERSNDATSIILGLFAGALVFFLGNVLINRYGGRNRKRSNGSQADGSGAAILLGTVLDGIPESIVIGLTLVQGGAISIGMIAAVFISNFPEAIAATTGLKASGWKSSRIIMLWVTVVIISALAALAGYVFFDTVAPQTFAFTLAFAGGAILTMLADTMMPEAFEDSGNLVGLMTTLGFGVAFAITTLT